MNKYTIEFDSFLNLVITHTAPCGSRRKVAYIPASEVGTKNPPLVFIEPVLGVNGIIQIAELLKKNLPTNPE